MFYIKMIAMKHYCILKQQNISKKCRKLVDITLMFCSKNISKTNSHKIHFTSCNKQQCNTNIYLWTEYEYKYIHNIYLDRIQIQNIFVTINKNICLKILNIYRKFTEYPQNRYRISTEYIFVKSI